MLSSDGHVTDHALAEEHLGLYIMQYWFQRELCWFFFSRPCPYLPINTHTRTYYQHPPHLVPSGAPQNLTAMGKSATRYSYRGPSSQTTQAGQDRLYEIMYRERLDATEDDTATQLTDTCLLRVWTWTQITFQDQSLHQKGAGPWRNQLPFRTFGN